MGTHITGVWVSTPFDIMRNYFILITIQKMSPLILIALQSHTSICEFKALEHFKFITNLYFIYFKTRLRVTYLLFHMYFSDKVKWYDAYFHEKVFQRSCLIINNEFINPMLVRWSIVEVLISVIGAQLDVEQLYSSFNHLHTTGIILYITFLYWLITSRYWTKKLIHNLLIQCHM